MIYNRLLINGTLFSPIFVFFKNQRRTWVFLHPGSIPQNPDDPQPENPEVPPPTPSGDAFTLQTLDGIIVLERGVEYWEKYQADSAHPGLYLRTDTVASFGDFLELNPDETYLLEVNGESTSGTWKVAGDQLVLNP